MDLKITTATLREMKKKKEKIVALTCYDAPMARLLDRAGVDVALVGDSVANVKLGYGNTLPVTLEEMLHHVRAAKRGNSRALFVADMPFLTYEFDPVEAVRAAGRFIKEGGAEAVKVEGGEDILPSVRAMVRANIAVMGHLGLTPQAVNRLGGYPVQGRDPSGARWIKAQAKLLEAAGVFALVLESVPVALARQLTQSLSIPTIGIGAGSACDGQILVLDDMLGLGDRPVPRFVKRYADLNAEATRAVIRYRDDVRRGAFPAAEQTYG
jgi:3-methyl-2-oxobutanoate hydroxymethyltransferase